MKKCPLINKGCIEHKCNFYVHLVGMHPQTGQATDEWNCAISWLPLLLVENSNMTRQSTASTDKVANIISGLRGEVNEGNKILMEARNMNDKRLLDADPKVRQIGRTGE